MKPRARPAAFSIRAWGHRPHTSSAVPLPARASTEAGLIYASLLSYFSCKTGSRFFSTKIATKSFAIYATVSPPENRNRYSSARSKPPPPYSAMLSWSKVLLT